MNHGGMLLCNTSFIGAGQSEYQTLNYGMQGVLVARANLIGVEVQLVGVGAGGSSLFVANSSKPILATSAVIGPLYLPAGQYAIRNVSSSAINVVAGIYPTP